ncbi:MAG: hypothetical protein WC307_07270 [Candidatus Nanoarchaeia archaeon]|jgi:uncharacterized membrane protein (DUF106 family)
MIEEFNKKMDELNKDTELSELDKLELKKELFDKYSKEVSFEFKRKQIMGEIL